MKYHGFHNGGCLFGRTKDDIKIPLAYKVVVTSHDTCYGGKKDTICRKIKSKVAGGGDKGPLLKIVRIRNS
jgi:hypothetical protein